MRSVRSVDVQLKGARNKYWTNKYRVDIRDINVILTTTSKTSIATKAVKKPTKTLCTGRGAASPKLATKIAARLVAYKSNLI